MTFSKLVVERIWTRDQGCCARCGVALDWVRRGFAWSVHHRCPRSMGGSSRLWVDQAANGLLLCGSGTTGCHGEVESNRDVARDEGFLVSAIGRLQARDVKVAHRLLGVVWLQDDGSWITAPVTDGWKAN